MYSSRTKILLISLVSLLFTNCKTTKKLNGDELLLTENKIFVNEELTNDKKLYNYLLQQPNKKILGIPVKLGIYNLATENADSLYVSRLDSAAGKKKFLRNLLSKKQVNRYVGRRYNFNEWLKKIGEKPAVVSKSKVEKSKKRLESYFWNRGWFNVNSTYATVLKDSSKAAIYYYLKTEKPYIIESVDLNIASSNADSIYNRRKHKSYIKIGEQYNTQSLENERNRITEDFRNNGLFFFERDYVKFDADTINNFRNIKLRLTINNPEINNNDSIADKEFKVRKIKSVKVYTDTNFKNSLSSVNDSAFYNGFNLYSYRDLKFKPKAITNAIFLTPNSVYSDEHRLQTYNAISNLGVFKYPTINIRKEKDGEDLEASIFLTPRNKYVFGSSFSISTSAIQDIGIGLEGSLSVRNFFRRAETFEIAARGNFGSSQEVIDNEDTFFNIVEFGLDARLKFPRIVFPLNTDKLIKKSSAPLTTFGIGISTQQNIGLDKENVNSNWSYKWRPNTSLTNEFKLFNVQYVRNLNTANYFNVYRNAYNSINSISKGVLPTENSFSENGNLTISERGVDRFLSAALSGRFDNLSSQNFIDLRNLSERRTRLTENNLIVSTEYNFIKDTRQNLYDEDFTRFRMKIESSGLILSALANILNVEENDNGNFDFFNVEYSQFGKLEAELVKHWYLGKNQVLAWRGFAGVAIPYGNSRNIPFSQSYFAGGANDNRGWLAYDLGPGSSSDRNEFNEANFKLAFNTEYRFNLIGDLHGAIFTDVGNIWNVLDSFEDEEDVSFSGLQDLEELSVASGLGFRYDFSFFIIRLDIGLKVHNPALLKGDRWFTDARLNKAVFNIGINYPF